MLEAGLSLFFPFSNKTMTLQESQPLSTFVNLCQPLPTFVNLCQPLSPPYRSNPGRGETLRSGRRGAQRAPPVRGHPPRAAFPARGDYSPAGTSGHEGPQGRNGGRRGKAFPQRARATLRPGPGGEQEGRSGVGSARCGPGPSVPRAGFW